MRRAQLKIERENLRKTLENREGITYQSNISFDSVDNMKCIEESTILSVENCKLVCFDLETSGRRKDADVLQIAAKVDENIFSIYIEPTQTIDNEASQVNGLENIDGELFLNGEKLLTVSMREALQAFYEFLSKFTKGSLLIAHNAIFDITFLVREIKKYSLVDEFKKIIYGFSDSLKLFRKKLSDRKGPGMFTLAKLAEDFLKNDSFEMNFHEATFDVIVLEKL
ncbi:uncharacterized protein LOC112452964, partial [Temnothorax curvispinosus]|uniref:Uncharacterized protein LOC112452964 n=1 Tax=Temnothorax curvispinosus TaxID=300111 RepID=A0A6J1PI22_9HYME